jgi:creatinine amidohydrolase
VSLAEQIRGGVTEFQAMGLTQAYAGAPAEATAEEGEDLYGRLAEMIATEVREGLARNANV